VYLKLITYISIRNDFDVLDFLKLFSFLVLTLFYSKKRFKVISLFIPLFVVTFILGEDRANMYGYFVFLYYSLSFNKGFNIGVIVTELYFLIKNYFFVTNILFKGTGFV
jgi:hypothetical protein